MASKKRKQEVFTSQLDIQGHDADQAPESAMQAKETADCGKHEPGNVRWNQDVYLSIAKQHRRGGREGDSDIGKKIQDVIEREYPRTRIGTDGWLQAILCELIRARLSK